MADDAADEAKARQRQERIDALTQRLERLTGRPLMAAREVPAPIPRATVHRPMPGPDLGGRVIRRSGGECLERTVVFRPDASHGRFALGGLEALTGDLVARLAGRDGATPRDLVFLDTETTGLATGAGTVAFLVGLGTFTTEGFQVTQYLMRDLPEEAALLEAVAESLGRDRVLVTYNGKSFDMPLLGGRYRISGRPWTPPDLHLDALYPARRLFRAQVGSARLVHLEAALLGFERVDDIPGALIPDAYFQYVVHGRFDLMDRVLTHNALDILSLAVIAALSARLMLEGAVEGVTVSPLTMARLARERGDLAAACVHLRQAVDQADKATARKLLEDLARLARRSGDPTLATWAWEQLLERTGGLHLAAYEHLSRLAERGLEDRAMAAHWCRTGLARIARGLAQLGGPVLEVKEKLRKRLERLERTPKPSRGVSG